MGAIILILIFFIALFIYLKNSSTGPQRFIPYLKGTKLIFNGEKKTEIFSSDYYQIKAKPDFMYQHKDESVSIVEYKSRPSGVKRSDISQLIATAIAVKAEKKHNVKFGYVLTENGSYEKIDLDRTCSDLIQEIYTPWKEAMNILNGGKATPKPGKEKCRGCGLKHACSFAK